MEVEKKDRENSLFLSIFLNIVVLLAIGMMIFSMSKAGYPLWAIIGSGVSMLIAYIGLIIIKVRLNRKEKWYQELRLIQKDLKMIGQHHKTSDNDI